MPNIHSLAFPSGGIVSVVTASGDVFVGTVLGIRHHDDSNELGVQFLFIQLSTAVEQYSRGDVVALNLTLIVSIGPI